MTNPNKTHITLVSDRSGSMRSIASDAEGGINSLIKDQAALDGECSILLVEFDTAHDTVYEGDVKSAPSYSLRPRGTTALNDAIGLAIVRTGEQLAALPEDERPSKVIFAVMTDGHENASTEYTLDQVKALIKEHTEKYSWEFSFLGAGLQVASQAVNMGFSPRNIVNFDPNSGVAAAAAFRSHSLSMTSYRGTGKASYAANVRSDGSVEYDDDRTSVKQ